MKLHKLKFLKPSEIKDLENIARKEGTDPKKWLQRLVRKSLMSHKAVPDLSPKEVGVHIGLSAETVRNMYHKGDFPGAYEVNARVIRIPVAAVEKYRASRTLAPI